jgi:hypothetical protein
MQCPSCRANISDTSKFCRYCGVQVFRKPDYQSVEQSSPAAAVAPARKITDVTRKLRPEFYPIPKRYEAELKSGTNPVAIIGELLIQKAEMRNLLEKIARLDGNGAAKDIKGAVNMFLLSHCVVCGEPMAPQETGKTPVCSECAKQG